MNILHLSSEKTWRGGEQQIAYLIEEHKKLGINSFIASKNGSDFSKYCTSQGWEFIEVPFSNSMDLKSALTIKRYCKEKRIDIVHMHSSASHGVGVISATLGNKAKLILSRRVDFQLKTNFLSKWKYNHPSIKKILCVSNKIKEIVQKSISNPSICETIYSGIDLSKFEKSKQKHDLKSKYNIAENNFLIGNTSALADHKDYFTFINTAKEVLSIYSEVSFIIFGKGPLEQEIKEYVTKLGLDGSFTFTGFVNNMPELLPQLNLFLMTSKTEGLGTSLLDAMACKVPIVATEAGGIPEIVKNEKTGLTTSVGDHKELAKLVLKIIESPVIGKQLSENAFSFVKKFDRTLTAEKTLSVYNQAI